MIITNNTTSDIAYFTDVAPEDLEAEIVETLSGWFFDSGSGARLIAVPLLANRLSKLRNGGTITSSEIESLAYFLDVTVTDLDPEVKKTLPLAEWTSGDLKTKYKELAHVYIRNFNPRTIIEVETQVADLIAEWQRREYPLGALVFSTTRI